MEELERTLAAPDPLERIRLATSALSDYQSAITELGKVRKDAVEELRAGGLTLTEIAQRTGISRGRLSQLGTTRRAPERAIFSAGAPVTIAVDTKQESQKGRVVIHQEHATALEVLGKTIHRVGLETSTTEYVVPPGFIDLNRDGLIVICGPKGSPLLEQILASDERYGLQKDADGWYLVDKSTGAEFRSPEDRGEPGDYAYLGTLPRPDGQGFYLYVAGIHASGGLGVAAYLENNLAELYDEVRGNRWSCLIQCEYDPKTHEIVKTSLLAPIHLQGKKSRAGKHR